MNKFLTLAQATKNEDYQRVCKILSLYRPGDVISCAEVATLAFIDEDTCMFILDDMMERAALLPYPPLPPVALARAA